MKFASQSSKYKQLKLIFKLNLNDNFILSIVCIWCVMKVYVLTLVALFILLLLYDKNIYTNVLFLTKKKKKMKIGGQIILICLFIIKD